MMWRRYGDYLTTLRDEAYRDTVFDYVEKEDSPVPVLTIVDHLRGAGFAGVEVLHKHNCFAALAGPVRAESRFLAIRGGFASVL